MKIDKPSLESLRIERPVERAARPVWPWLAAAAAVLLIAVLIVLLVRSGPPEVRLATAAGGVEGGSQTVLNATGYVTARRQATVSSKVTGKVLEVRIEEGQRVREGEMLARLDDAGVQAELRLAEAKAAATSSALEELRVRIAEARLDLDRASHLMNQQVASKMDYDRSKAQLDALEARLNAQNDQFAVSQREVRLRQQDVEDLVIRAPFDGVVVSKNAQPGEMISPNSAGGGFTRTGICTIVDMESLEVEVDVNEAYITRVRSDQPVEIVLDAYPDRVSPGHVITIVPTADRQKATVRVRIGFEERDERILPDMGARVSFREEELAATAVPSVTIPRTAVVSEGGSDVVFVYSEGRAERRAISVAGGRGEDVEISAGIRTGERVIIDPPSGLSDGDRVRVEES